MKKVTPKEIAERYRQNGNSTWIIKSAIENPECIILTYNKASADDMKDNYFAMLEAAHWTKKLKWWLFGRKHPKFLSISSNLDGYKLPIIFDNSAMY
jgi:hypothetical protein